MYLNDLFEEMNSFFEEMDSPKYVSKNVSYAVPNFPPSEMRKLKDGTVKLEMALAGYSDADIDISTEENKLVVSTKEDYKQPELEEGAKILGGKIKRCAFKSSFIVPETKFSFADITAKFEGGILTITIPPKEKKEYKKISING